MNPSLYLGLNGTVLLSTLKPFTDSLWPAWQIQVPWSLPASLPLSLACLQHFSPRGWPEGPQRALPDEHPRGFLCAASPEELPRFPLLPLTNTLSSVFKRLVQNSSTPWRLWWFSPRHICLSTQSCFCSSIHLSAIRCKLPPTRMLGQGFYLFSSLLNLPHPKWCLAHSINSCSVRLMEGFHWVAVCYMSAHTGHDPPPFCLPVVSPLAITLVTSYSVDLFSCLFPIKSLFPWESVSSSSSKLAKNLAGIHIW